MKNKERVLICPECGAKMTLRDSRFGLFYGCEHFPECQATHGAHPDGRPLGKPADGETKSARMKVHALFDMLWEDKYSPMTRAQAYKWLSDIMNLTPKQAHIGGFDKKDCQILKEHLYVYFLIG